MAKNVKLTISYGYSIHSIVISKEEHACVKEGLEIEVDGQGFLHEEDGLVPDHWVFNRTPREIMFWLDSGAEFYAQSSWVENE